MVMGAMKKGTIGIVFAAVIVVVLCAFAVRLEASADSVAVLRAQGMTCGSCAGKIEKTLGKQAGVARVQVDVDAGKVVVGFDSRTVRPEILAERVTGVGYGCSILQVLTPEEYRAQTGSTTAFVRQGGGCGGGCCGK